MTDAIVGTAGGLRAVRVPSSARLRAQLAAALRATLLLPLQVPMTTVLVLGLVGSDAVMRWGVSNPLRVARWASTNVENLQDHPLAAFLASTFLAPGAGISTLLIALAISCGVLERHVGKARTALVLITGQVIASLITEGGVRIAVVSGHEATTALTRLDVGLSYVAFTAVGAALAFADRHVRLFGLLAVAAYVVVPLVVDRDMTTSGHVLSLAIGVLSWPLLRSAPRRGLAHTFGTRMLSLLAIVGVLAAYAPV